MKYIGLVDWLNVDKGGHRIAGVTPLFEVTELVWRPVCSEEFPTQGKVFWFQANAEKDTLIYFRSEENTGQFRDHFKVVEPQLAIEILDLRMIGSPEKVRQALSTGLLHSRFMPTRALLWCEDNLFVGPVNIRLTESGTYTFEHPQRHKIQCYSKKIDVREVSYDRTLRYVVADLALGSPGSFVDWDDDKFVIRRAITWAVDRAKESGHQPKLTRYLIQQAAEQLIDAGSSPELKLEQYRLHRVTEITNNLSLSEELAQSAIESLKGHPVIAQQLDHLREEVMTMAAADSNEALSAERLAIEVAKREREQILSEVKIAYTELETLRARINEEVQEVEDEVNRRVGEILEKPATLLAEVAILQAVQRGTSNSGPEGVKSQNAKNLQAITWAHSTKIVTNLTELRKLLVTSSKAVGVPTKVCSRIHSAICAGLIPVLMGPRSLKALEAYSRVVCGGRMFRVNISPSYLDPGDLFGRLDYARGRFLPHPAGLADVLESARRSRGYALVVIEGANRAPTESYLIPIIQCAFSKLNLQLFHPSLISPKDAYRDLAEVQWPSNLLLSASIVEGVTTLPVCHELWNDAVLIETDCEVQKAWTTPEAAEIDPESGLIGGEAQTEVATNYFETLTGYKSLRGASDRFLAALSSFEGDPNKLFRALAESILLPFAASINDEDERSELLQQLTEVCNSAGFETSELMSMTRRIRRRIA